MTTNPENGPRPLALITGASRRAGIGAAIARHLARDGWDVATTFWRAYDEAMPHGSEAGDIDRLRAELTAYGARTVAVEADLSLVETPAQVFDAVENAIGPVTALVLSHCHSVESDILGHHGSELRRTLRSQCAGELATRAIAVSGLRPVRDALPPAPPGPRIALTMAPTVRQPPVALRKFLAPYDPKISRLFLATRRAVLLVAPQATELIYDAYNAVSAVYTFTDRLKEAFCHVAAYPGYVNLGFNRGAALDDPDGLLVGTGARIRHLRISAPPDLQRPGVRRLVRAAVAEGRSWTASPPSAPRSIVQAVYAQRRRPSSRTP